MTWTVSAAASVRNQWSLGIVAALVGTAAGDPSVALRSCVDAALDLQKKDAWYTAWYLPGVLWDLGRAEDAALALGACERSLARPPGYRLPSPLQEIMAGGGPALLQQQRAVGAKLDLVQLIRVIDPGDAA